MLPILTYLVFAIALSLRCCTSYSVRPTPKRFRNRVSTEGSRHGSLPLHSTAKGDKEVDVVIIGSGIAGLSCGAILASQGYEVIVCESHYEIGGCAHEFCFTEEGSSIPSDRVGDKRVFRFEAGPSLYSGLSPSKSPNPLKHVFQMIGEEPEWITYDLWGAYIPEAPNGYKLSIGAEAFQTVLETYGGPTAKEDWEKLSKAMRPLTDGVMSLPSVAIRPDAGALITLGLRYTTALFKTIMQGGKLTRPFSDYYEELGIKDAFLKNYLNLLCFLLQGLPAEGTLSAVMAYMIDDFYRPNAVMDFPKGGSGAIADALERGILKHNGEVRRRAHVEEILVEDGRAVGVRLRSQKKRQPQSSEMETSFDDDDDNNVTILRARRAVVSNCDMWTTYNLVPRGKDAGFDEERDSLFEKTPMCKSFMHLHLGIDAKDLPANIPPQWTVCKDWSQPIDAPGNVIVVSMPSLLDPSLAPSGRHVIHAYTAGNEPYEIWAKFKGNLADPDLKKEYESLKADRAACLWDAVGKEIPDIRERTIVQLTGTPLTHERFNRRYMGTYGPGIAAGSGMTFSGAKTPIGGLLRCGDSTNPGIGVPAVASSGAIAANAVLSIQEHWSLLDRIKF